MPTQTEGHLTWNHLPTKKSQSLLNEEIVQMKRITQLMVLAGALAISNACNAAENPFDVSLKVINGTSVIQLESATDKVVLTGFNVNRGNCTQTKTGGIYPLPLTFKFGDGLKLFAYCNKVKEVSLTTDRGSFTYSFH